MTCGPRMVPKQAKSPSLDLSAGGGGGDPEIPSATTEGKGPRHPCVAHGYRLPTLSKSSPGDDGSKVADIPIGTTIQSPQLPTGLVVVNASGTKWSDHRTGYAGRTGTARAGRRLGPAPRQDRDAAVTLTPRSRAPAAQDRCRIADRSRDGWSGEPEAQNYRRHREGPGLEGGTHRDRRVS